MEGDILGTGARVSVGTGISPTQCPACQRLLSPTASPGPLMYPYQSLHRISCPSLTQCLALSPILLAQLLPGPMQDRPVGPSALRSLCWLCCIASSSSLTAFPLPGVLHLVSEHCPSYLLECLSLGFCLPPASSVLPHSPSSACTLGLHALLSATYRPPAGQPHCGAVYHPVPGTTAHSVLDKWPDLGAADSPRGRWP